jgi:hypothetical protein
MCNCSKRVDAAGAKAQAKKPVTVAYPDGSKKTYDTETAARIAAASKGGKLVNA